MLIPKCEKSQTVIWENNFFHTSNFSWFHIHPNRTLTASQFSLQCMSINNCNAVQSWLERAIRPHIFRSDAFRSIQHTFNSKHLLKLWIRYYRGAISQVDSNKTNQAAVILASERLDQSSALRSSCFNRARKEVSNE